MLCVYVFVSVCDSVRVLLINVLLLLQENITKHKYHTIDGLEADVVLLCQNTHTYNVEGSQVSGQLAITMLCIRIR